VSPRGRHKAGSGHLADEPWQRTSDRATWRAYRHGLILTVSWSAAQCWVADIEGNGVTDRAPSPIPDKAGCPAVGGRQG